MKQLDPTVLEVLADIICGEGDTYRKGWQIGRFLQSVDPIFPEHDGSTRKWWTLDQLKKCNNNVDGPPFLNLDSLEAVILRLTDPREYRGSMQAAETVREQLNRILVLDGLEVSLVDTKPQLKEVTPHVLPDKVSTSQYLRPDFRKLTPDQELAAILQSLWDEALKSMSAQAYLATLILLGSILEGALLAVIGKNMQTACSSSKSPKDKQGGTKHINDWTLNERIEVASDCGWINRDRLRHSHALRESRNLVHPSARKRLGEAPDESTCNISWQVVQAVVGDLLLVGP